MPRKVLMQAPGGACILIEDVVHSEQQLQKLLRDHPDLLPIEDMDLQGPALVVGKETGVLSGSIDLVLVARGGEIVLVEFKRGPENPDFRGALAQTLDYGSDLWQMSPEDFERQVALRYFNSTEVAPKWKGCPSMETAMKLAGWEMQGEDMRSFWDRLSSDLADGTFTYVVAAQRLTTPMLRTAEYLNATHRSSRFYLVELVRFAGQAGEEVFEARTVLRPMPSSTPSSSAPRKKLTLAALMRRIGETPYTGAILTLLDAATKRELVLFWGSAGLSIRLRSRTTGLASVGWFNPPEVVGWNGLRDLVLGYSDTSKAYLQEKARIDPFMDRVSDLGGDPVSVGTLRGFHFTPEQVVAQIDTIIDALDLLIPVEAPDAVPSGLTSADDATRAHTGPSGDEGEPTA